MKRTITHILVEEKAAKTRSCRSVNRAAFTLIEMLVVIAIIALLASMIVPAVSGAMKRAKQTQSAAQLRSLSLGILEYTYEKQRFPLGYDRIEGESWDMLLRDRFGITEQDLHAPLDQVKRTVGSPEARNDPGAWRSYSLVRNEVRGEVLGVAGRRWSDTLNRPSTLLSMVQEPARTLLLVERFDPSNLMFDLSGAVIDYPAQQQAGDAYTIRGKYVYSFCDGHVKVLRPEETIGQGTMTQALGMWTYAPGD